MGKNRSTNYSTHFYLIICYNNYLYSDSYRSLILTSSAIASFSKVCIVGEVSPLSILWIVDLLTPLFSSSFSNVILFLVLTSHSSIFILWIYLEHLNFIIHLLFHFCRKNMNIMYFYNYSKVV